MKITIELNDRIVEGLRIARAVEAYESDGHPPELEDLLLRLIDGMLDAYRADVVLDDDGNIIAMKDDIDREVEDVVKFGGDYCATRRAMIEALKMAARMK